MENVLITGVSGGIGRAVAEALLKEGGSVIGLVNEHGEKVQTLVEKYEGRFHVWECDLLDSNSLTQIIKEIVTTIGPIGGFVHCAGFDRMMPLHLTKEDDFEKLWRLHALAPMVMIGAISKKRNHLDKTSIVLISSQSAHEGAMGHTAYASAKGAIEGFLAPAAAELMEKGIRINEVCFAPIKTPMASEWMDKLTDEGKQKLLESYPLGLGEVSDASELICFLLSEKAHFVNGQIITADGGHSVRKV